MNSTPKLNFVLLKLIMQILNDKKRENNLRITDKKTGLTLSLLIFNEIQILAIYFY